MLVAISKVITRQGNELSTDTGRGDAVIAVPVGDVTVAPRNRSRRAYRGHTYRVFNIARRVLGRDDADDLLAVTSAFHDLGIWSDNTFDYLSPSVARARTWLERRSPSLGVDVDLCHAVGRGCTALLTAMDEPLGNAVGNACEVQESIEILQNKGPADVRELTLQLGIEMLLAADADALHPNHPLASQRLAGYRARLEKALEDGSALERFAQLIEAQGGDRRVCDDFGRLPEARLIREVRATQSGVLQSLDAEQVGLAAVELGAGRARKEDKVDPAAGLWLLKKAGDAVSTGDVLAELHGETEARLDAGEARILEAARIGERDVARKALILERIA